MKCCDIQAGLLNRQVTIERKSVTSDGMGGNTEAWSVLCKVWALVKPLSGGEHWQASRIMPGVRYRCIVAYRCGLDGSPYYSAKDRVVFDGRTHSIESVIDIEMKREWLELMLIEGKPS